MKELLDKLEEYLKRPSLDGHPSRQEMRKELKRLLYECKTTGQGAVLGPRETAGSTEPSR